MMTTTTTAAVFLVLLGLVDASLLDLIDLMDSIQSLTKRFAFQVEKAYRQRCNESILGHCESSQYALCKTALNINTRTCPSKEEGEHLHEKSCGDGVKRNSFTDYCSAAVHIPETQSHEDPMIMESTCYGQLFDDFMKDGYKRSKALYEVVGVREAPFFYFGSSSGVFRMYPARPWDRCDFDPRERPWYVAASSTPKTVVIVLDISGYSSTTGDFKHAKKTAKALVLAMANADRVSVVFMSDAPTIVHVENDLPGSEDQEFVMDQATNQVQQALKVAINNQTETSRPDAAGAFNLAFDLLNGTVTADKVDCNVAMVLITSERDLRILPTDLIKERKQEIETLTDRTMLFFGYNTGKSFTEEARSLECSFGAVWSILDSSRDDRGIVDNVRLFHEAFALNLGRETRGDGPAVWSEPYQFYPLELTGVTVAVPVFDRTVSPPLFLGVVGTDATLKTFHEALKGDDTKSDVRKQLASRRQRQCGPSFSPCDLEGLRRRARSFVSFLGDGIPETCLDNDDITCDDGDIPTFERAPCPANTEWPKNLWKIQDEDKLNFTARACCSVENNTEDVGQCPNVDFDAHDDTQKKRLVGMESGVVVIALFVTLFFVVIAVLSCILLKERSLRKGNDPVAPPPQSRPSGTLTYMSRASSVLDEEANGADGNHDEVNAEANESDENQNGNSGGTDWSGESEERADDEDAESGDEDHHREGAGNADHPGVANDRNNEQVARDGEEKVSEEKLSETFVNKCRNRVSEGDNHDGAEIVGSFDRNGENEVQSTAETLSGGAPRFISCDGSAAVSALTPATLDADGHSRALTNDRNLGNGT